MKKNEGFSTEIILLRRQKNGVYTAQDSGPAGQVAAIQRIFPHANVSNREVGNPSPNTTPREEST